MRTIDDVIKTIENAKSGRWRSAWSVRSL